MQQNGDGKWTYAAWVDEREADWQNYLALEKKWNRFVPEYNRLVAPKEIGRPLAASDTQIAQVLKLHRAVPRYAFRMSGQCPS